MVKGDVWQQMEEAADRGNWKTIQSLFYGRTRQTDEDFERAKQFMIRAYDNSNLGLSRQLMRHATRPFENGADPEARAHEYQMGMELQERVLNDILREDPPQQERPRRQRSAMPQRHSRRTRQKNRTVSS